MVSPFYQPKEIQVAADGLGEPMAVKVDRRWRKVALIRNTWRIDDEWWREEIARRYFEVELVGNSVVTVFNDLVSGKWYRQRY